MEVGEESSRIDKGRYQRLVGKLIYFSHIRPDVNFLVSDVSQLVNNHEDENLEAVYRILRYLNISLEKGLLFTKSENRDISIY